MKHPVIIVNGVSYPCAPTMGAMLRFKQETGREVTEIDTSSFTDMCTYLWCCVTSASRREHKDFSMSLLEFADSISPEDMSEWNLALSSGDAGATSDEEQKKSPQGSMTS